MASGRRRFGTVAVTATWFALVLLAAGCGDGGGKGGGGDNTNPDKPVEVSEGERFRIKIESNPTTGYEWTIAGTPDAAVVKAAGDEYVPDREGAAMPGSGGNQFFTFEAVGKGRTKITFTYDRPWEKKKGTPPADTKAFTVEVS